MQLLPAVFALGDLPLAIASASAVAALGHRVWSVAGAIVDLSSGSAAGLEIAQRPECTVAKADGSVAAVDGVPQMKGKRMMRVHVRGSKQARGELLAALPALVTFLRACGLAQPPGDSASRLLLLDDTGVVPPVSRALLFPLSRLLLCSHGASVQYQ